MLLIILSAEFLHRAINTMSKLSHVDARLEFRL